MVDRFFKGAGYFFQGLGMLGQKGIRRYVWVPVVMNLVLLAAMIRGVQVWLADWQGFESGWLSWASWLVVPLLVLLVVVVFGYFFSALLVAVASPFYGLLAGHIEQRDGVLAEDEPLWRLTVRTFQREWKKILYFMPRYGVLLLLSLVPLVQLVMPVFWFLFGSWTLALQYRDYTLDNLGVPFADSRRQLGEDRWAALGFGAVVSVLMLVPILNCFVPPAAVIGGSLWALEQRRLRLPQ